MSQAVEYDYVVVGAGTAGSVLAARLSARGDARVLLLEAGGSEMPEAMPVPPAWPLLLGTSSNWGDRTTEQASTGTSVPLARGRGIGGSSAINAMVFTRGHRASYDAWAAGDAKGWDFDALLPYLMRSERAEGRDPGTRGQDGPLTVAPAREPNPVLEACLEAAAEVGHPRAADISSGLEEGFGRPDLNIVDGRRQSAADAYLAPASGRAGLRVVTGALVHRVLVDGGRCTGVAYTVGSREFTVRAAREVVLTAGAIGTPQLLMLSGIGPQRHLRETGVEVLHDLPGVGGNLQDHVMAGLVYSAARPVPAARNNHGEALGLLRSTPTADAPDLQIIFVDVPSHAPTLAGPREGYTIRVSLMRPHSRGTVRLASSSPGTAPVIDPGYYTDPRDLPAMIAGIRAAREIGRAKALDPWRGEEVLPGVDVRDDEAIGAYLRRGLASYFHPVGTCRLGTDEHAVVDEELRVRGIGGLRVADASVMPSIVSGNTNATVYAIAERAADFLSQNGV
ncbi:GMC family oxidoreductase N-terminal domain-containing protein [Streptomyces sp. NPDC026673]|uniref:GMC family oxidoreductase n=1 Tax=Streptomyces sp. NPDC026673 TaxID=3155724 RepID=UPI0033F0FCAD